MDELTTQTVLAKLPQIKRDLEQAIRHHAEKEAHTNCNGDVEINQEAVTERALEDDELISTLIQLADLMYEDIADEVICELRQQWAYEREIERTNRSLDTSLRSAEIATMNREAV